LRRFGPRDARAGIRERDFRANDHAPGLVGDGAAERSIGLTRCGAAEEGPTANAKRH